MYECKKGFTLVEIMLVVVLIIASFSMSLAVLGSFSNSNQKYIEKDLDEVKGLLSQFKYFTYLGEKDVTYKCDKNKISSLFNNQVIDEKELKTLACDRDKLSNGSSTFEIRINQYGYVSFKRI